MEITPESEGKSQNNTGGHRNNANGASVEVLRGDDDLDVVAGNSLLERCPALREFQRRFNRFGARVHRQHFIITKIF